MRLSVLLVPFLIGACSDVTKPEEVNENEVITTVALTFTPTSGGEPSTFSWSDPEYDGNPTIDPILLSDAQDYTVDVSFLNELEQPAEDITEEVDAEREEHQLFFTGTAVEGPATGDNAGAVVSHAYADADASELPVGLSNSLATIAPGSGTLTITLRHLPPENDTPTKTAGLAERVAAAGFEGIPGETDAQVDFELSVE